MVGDFISDYLNSLVRLINHTQVTIIPSGPGVESTSDTSVASVELFVARRRRTINVGETEVYSSIEVINCKDCLFKDLCVTSKF